MAVKFITLKCPNQHIRRVSSDRIGQKVVCDDCGAVMVVPAPQAPIFNSVVTDPPDIELLSAEADDAEATIRCPDCAEVIQARARVCKHCGSKFAAPSPVNFAFEATDPQGRQTRGVIQAVSPHAAQATLATSGYQRIAVTLQPAAAPAPPPSMQPLPKGSARCPFCGWVGAPDRQSKTTSTGWIAAFFIGITCIGLPLAIFVPLLMTEVHMHCRSCHGRIATG